MVEFHVDDCHIFEERENNETKFGGNLSVRRKKKEKPLLMFGHDECIIKQYTMTGKHGKAPNGAVDLIPKDDAQGVMISMFQSRELGFRVQINELELTLVNT